MPKTLFRPQIDNPGNAFADAIEKIEFGQMRRHFLSAVEDAVDMLEPLYRVALDIYDIRNNLSHSVAGEIPPDYMLHGGMIFCVLDYYNARRFLPSTASRKEKSKEDFAAFFRHRTLDNIKSNSAILLHNTAIVYLIPAKWLPESWLIDPVREEIGKLPIFKETTIDLTLRLPSGGIPWLRDKCQQEWQRLKEHLDSGRPWPIRLIGSGLNPFENESVIAYGYEESNRRNGTIYIYDMKSPGREHTIRFKYCGTTQITVESCSNPHFDNIRGFYCETYSPQIPPAGGGFRFLRLIVSVKTVWYLIRLARIFRLWMISR
jgi:hypothetical protein